MLFCDHKRWDPEKMKYHSIIRKVAPHNYKCKQCGMRLHDLDVYYVSKDIKNKNTLLKGDMDRQTEEAITSAMDIIGSNLPIFGKY